MTSLEELAADQRQTFETYLKARPFTDRERDYWALCWMQVTQQQVDDINALLPPDTILAPRTIGGTLYINADLLSDAVDGGPLEKILSLIEGLTWTYIDPWKWEQTEVPAWKAYDGTPATIYDVGTVVSHQSQNWVSTTPRNVWEPSIFGWREVTEQGIAPKWRQPLGAGDAWGLNDEVLHRNKQWRSLHAANVWEPGTDVRLWLDITKTEPDVTPVIPDWRQPQGAHDAYARGARVTFQGRVWTNTGSDANVWQPGVFGWVAT